MEDDKTPDLLKLARLKLNLALGIFAFICLLVLQQLVLPRIFDPEVETVLLEEDSESAFMEVDSSEIVDGIHVPSGLIVDDGYELVMMNCGACHSLQLVTQNRMTREGWKDIIVWMQETQKLWDLGEKEPFILDYLAKNYAPENTGRRKNLEGIEWYNLKE